ncbi:unnamed protein product [Rotaria sp. Silwood2]|nr:unnamed protein product [Rotaria sp. Silwood2]CAF3348622.1 unnamed protein product [Rotaria sp. Silwood2]CAF4662520.1 unnamed protein product [Rotaria sp. Silwood2]CAF4668097.1 unnamed protein product [Rotaria sp. Silwood2]
MASALQYLSEAHIIHGNIAADIVLIYRLDDLPDSTLIKLANIGEIEASSNYAHPERSDVYAFGQFALNLYCLLQSDNNDEYLTKRKNLFHRCLEADENERFTFNELTEDINKFIKEDQSISTCKSH